jgi:membrane protease YdiL (CAAX protease family)
VGDTPENDDASATFAEDRFAGAAEGAARPPGSRTTAVFEVLLCSGFPTQLFVAQLALLAGLNPTGADGRLSLSYVVVVLLGDAALLLTLVFTFLKLRGEQPRHVLLGSRRPGRETLLGVALIPVVFALAVFLLALINAFLPRLRTVEVNPLQAMIRSRRDAFVLGAVAVASGGIREEVQRAFILHRFEQHLGGALVGLVVFSLLFGAGHTIQGWDVAVATAGLGAFWGIVFLLRGSVVAPMVSHSGFNVAEIIRYTLTGS